MAEIYSDLPSPRISVIPGSPGERTVRRLLDYNDNLDGLGIRSTLYKYQRRSIASMIQKELPMTDFPDPLFIPIVGMNGRVFYLQPARMEILQDQPMVAPTRGGVLCEELGVYI